MLRKPKKNIKYFKLINNVTFDIKLFLKIYISSNDKIPKIQLLS